MILIVPFSCLQRRHKKACVPFCHILGFIYADTKPIVVNDLWKGSIVQKHNEDHDIECALLPFVSEYVPSILSIVRSSTIPRNYDRWHLGSPRPLSSSSA